MKPDLLDNETIKRILTANEYGLLEQAYMRVPEPRLAMLDAMVAELPHVEDTMKWCWETLQFAALKEDEDVPTVTSKTGEKPRQVVKLVRRAGMVELYVDRALMKQWHPQPQQSEEQKRFLVQSSLDTLLLEDFEQLDEHIFNRLMDAGSVLGRSPRSISDMSGIRVGAWANPLFLQAQKQRVQLVIVHELRRGNRRVFWLSEDPHRRRQ